jgi:histidine triad (HIT) family protein
MQDVNCIFCKIVSGKLKARIINENDYAMAFLDAFPLSSGHTLVVPKAHYSKVQDMDKEYSCAVFSIACQIAAILEPTVRVNASTIAIHNGRDAGQEVPHVHIHIVPRSANDGAGPIHSMFKRRPRLNNEEMDELADKLRKILNS